MVHPGAGVRQKPPSLLPVSTSVWTQQSPPATRPPARGLTQSADGAVVGLVAQGVRTGVTQAEVATGQNQGVPDVRQTHDTLSTVITDFVLSHLAGDTEV